MPWFDSRRTQAAIQRILNEATARKEAKLKAEAEAKKAAEEEGGDS